MIVIVKSDGSLAGPMPQAQAESYLFNVHKQVDLNASMKQALNDLTGGKGKASTFSTGKNTASVSYMFKGKPVLHASSGDGESSISLFFYRLEAHEYVIAMGEHAGKVKGKETYKLCHYGQDGDPLYKKGATISLG